MRNFHNCNNNGCPPSGFISECCNPQTVPIDSSQQQQLINLLNSLTRAISAFFANPSDANRLALSSLFTQFLDFLNSLPPSPEGNYLKQLIQSILGLLQSPNPDLGQLSSLLQQFNAGLSSFLSTLMIDPATLQLLFSLIPQLIKASPGATGPTGVTGPTGPTGATGSFQGATGFNPANAPSYLPGQVIIYMGSSYVVNVPNPQGTPGSSPDYTLIASAGATGPTG
ncbi:collagen-like repeat preface domain-containing protein, partial [Bacillus thuringiensis]|nr:collagen-like repeat preface domain-containing protein [Bacillus thuringiensis]